MSATLAQCIDLHLYENSLFHVSINSIDEIQDGTNTEIDWNLIYIKRAFRFFLLKIETREGNEKFFDLLFLFLFFVDKGGSSSFDV